MSTLLAARTQLQGSHFGPGNLQDPDNKEIMTLAGRMTVLLYDTMTQLCSVFLCSQISTCLVSWGPCLPEVWGVGSPLAH